MTASLPPDVDRELLAFIRARGIGQLKHVDRGRLLHWQGDPVDTVGVVADGAVKLSSVSGDGRVRTSSLLGTGDVLGAGELLLGRTYESVAEAVEDAEVVVIAADEFRALLAGDSDLALLVMRRLAHDVHSLRGKVQDLTALDVRQRIKASLLELAHVHGVETERGIRIDLTLTHQEIGEMVAANRTTITACLGELRREGYLWREGRHLFIIPLDHVRILDSLEEAVVDGSEQDARRLAIDAVERGVDPVDALAALTRGMRGVDRMLARNDIELSDVILSAYAMKSAISIIEDEIARTNRPVPYLGAIVIGTVMGDIHDIGRTLVSMLLKARGFRVIDLGVNVPSDRFVEAVRVHRPQILALSTLMTTTAREQFKVIDALTEAGLRDQVKVIVGGNAITPKLSREMGADGYEPSARLAAELAWRLSGERQSPLDPE